MKFPVSFPLWEMLDFLVLYIAKLALIRSADSFPGKCPRKAVITFLVLMQVFRLVTDCFCNETTHSMIFMRL